LKNLIMKDRAYHFLQTVRGSPPYWQKAQYKLLAAVKQLGIFTFFMTLSSADLKWIDSLNAALKKQGRNLTYDEIENMTYEERCKILRTSPVTVACHFDNRLKHFFKHVVCSEAKPLGKINNYSYRIEFQKRGSPHAHCVLWTDGAPGPKSDFQEQVRFIDKYITCSIPDKNLDPELYELVTSVQIHHHTQTCRKKSTQCRFGFSKLPSPQTVIAKKPDEEDIVLCNATIETAADMLLKVSDELDKYDETNCPSLEEIVSSVGISMDQYVFALSISKRGQSVILKRNVNERNVNYYNKDLLLAWGANMDIQKCTDAYGCIAYMVSYLTKDEREMSTVLQNVSKETADQGFKEQMKACASAFLKAREVSAQECAYRMMSLSMFVCTFSFEFVPANFPEDRVRLVKPKKLIECMENEDDDVFCTNIIERYSARPIQLSDMCLAHFAISYKPSYSRKNDENQDSETDSENDDVDINAEGATIQLRNDLGTMKRRKKVAILRYHIPSRQKKPSEYFYCQLLMFLPWRDEISEIYKLKSYEEHYNTNEEVITSNREHVERHVDLVEQALKENEQYGPPVHAYDSISNQTQQEFAEDNILQTEVDPQFEALNPDEACVSTSETNDMSIPVSNDVNISTEARPNFMPENEFSRHVQSLNTKQRDAFARIAQWCQNKHKSNNDHTNVDHLCLFITGGAGSGKSHLIHAVYQIAVRIFQEHGEDPDKVHALITAPTGSAAYNVSGTTLHSAFLIPIGQAQSYQKLSDDKLNSVRTKLSSLKLLIIDEISMVGSTLLLQLHNRLSEIMSSNAPFGGVAILAFGDLYQLKPVKQKFIFDQVIDPIARLYGSLWSHFQLIELTEIMRQRNDRSFAEMLNRVRKNEQTDSDIQLLKEREVTGSYPEDILHVFAANKDVDSHNAVKLASLGTQIETLPAIDKKPNALSNYKIKENNSRLTGGLENEVVLATGARVMLTRNIDVSDGLVNGAQGVVVGFVNTNRTCHRTNAVLVRFDDKKVGENARKKTQYIIELQKFPGATPIQRIEVAFSVSKKNKNLNITRCQFPIKLSWACTIHKVQGLTVDKILVSFKSRKGFDSGQAYVALSRVRSIEGLYLKEFESDKIRKNNNVDKELQRMKENEVPRFYDMLYQKSDLIISVLNVRSLPEHASHLLKEPAYLHSDIIVCVETWLADRQQTSDYLQEQDTVCHRCDKLGNGIGQRTAGGVLIVTKRDKIQSARQIYEHSERYLQILGLSLKTVSGKTLQVFGVYKSPSSTESLNEQLNAFIHDRDASTIVTGDFNENLFADRKPNYEFMIQNNFEQHVNTPTNQVSGSCIDHFYTRNLTIDRTTVHFCYFSDHAWLTTNVNL
jgi:hypothetical protein